VGILFTSESVPLISLLVLPKTIHQSTDGFSGFGERRSKK